MDDETSAPAPKRTDVAPEMHSNREPSPVCVSDEGVSIRLLSPLVAYPLGEFRSPEASLVVRSDIMAMVTSFAKVQAPDGYYSETEFLSPFEVRLLSTVLLSWDTDSGMFGLYPVRTELLRPYTGMDLSNTEVLDGLIDEFRAFLQQDVPLAEIHRPPCVGGSAYTFNEYSARP
jgi:hypothetical protein